MARSPQPVAVVVAAASLAVAPVSGRRGSVFVVAPAAAAAPQRVVGGHELHDVPFV